jgi:hypothetical protein
MSTDLRTEIIGYVDSETGKGLDLPRCLELARVLFAKKVSRHNRTARKAAAAAPRAALTVVNLEELVTRRFYERRAGARQNPVVE